MIVDFFISVYDTLVDDRKMLKDKTAISKLIKKIDEWTISSADYVISDTRTHGKYFCEEFHIPEKKIIPIYLKADISLYHPMCVERTEKYRDKFIVLYFGSILPVQGVEVILETIEQLKNNKNIHFIMIGPISEKYKKVVSDTVTYYEWLPQEELAEQIAGADLCLGGHFSATIGKANRTIPGKVYIYQAMEKMVVLGDSDANRELFKQDKKTLFVKRGSSEELTECIEMCYSQMLEERDVKQD